MNTSYRGSPPQRGSAQHSQRGPSPEVSAFKNAITAKRFTDDTVLEQSEALAKSLMRGIGGMKKENSLTQVRKFYNQVKVIQRQASATEDFTALKPRLRLLQAQAAYSVARELLTEDFKVFLDASVDKMVREGKDALEDFAKFFEAVYAYFYYQSKQ